MLDVRRGMLDVGLGRLRRAQHVDPVNRPVSRSATPVGPLPPDSPPAGRSLQPSADDIRTPSSARSQATRAPRRETKVVALRSRHQPPPPESELARGPPP